VQTRYLIPPISIAPYVSGILIIEDANERHDFTLPLFANGCPTLDFQTTTATKEKDTIGHLTLYGQTIRPAGLLLKEKFTLIAIFFYPHTLKTLFGIHPKEITDGYLDPALLPKTSSATLSDQLLNTPAVPDRLRLIEQYILQLATRSTEENKQAVFAAAQISKSNGLSTLPALQKDMHITERSFHRLFENNIGISPNLYRRICQFQFAFRQVNSYQFNKLTDVVYSSGFADQSHFIRVFREFTGLTPLEYLAKLAPYNPRF
jgi:AraC-like DNA-binding protein